MLPHVRRTPLLIAVLIAFSCLLHARPSGTATAATTDFIVDGLGKGSVALDGPWQFHLGDNAAWALPETDDTGAGWEQLTTDQPWGEQGHYNYTGFAWYRRHVRVGGTDVQHLDLALLIENVDDAYEVYWDGLLIGKFGKLPPNPVLYFDQPNQTYGLGAARSGVLAVRVWMPAPMSADPGSSGGFESTPLLGTAEAIAAAKAKEDYHWLRSRQIGFGICSLAMLIAVLSFFAWLRDRSQWMLFWMAVFCLYSPLEMFILEMRLKVSAALEYALMQPVYAMNDVALWFLLLWLLGLWNRQRAMKGTRIAAIVILTASLVDGLDTLFGWTSPYTALMQTIDAVSSIVTISLAPVSLVLIGIAIRRQATGGVRLNFVRWLVAGVAFLDEIIVEAGNASMFGLRFTRWSFSDLDRGASFLRQWELDERHADRPTRCCLLVLVYAVYRSQMENRMRQRHLEQEFQSARELQQVLIPEDLPAIPGFTLTSAYKPALEVGGDFFQIVSLADRSTLVVVGDVSGKGLRAAMAVSLIVGAIRTLAEAESSPAAILAGLNRRLHGRLRGGFATAIALRITADRPVHGRERRSSAAVPERSGARSAGSAASRHRALRVVSGDRSRSGSIGPHRGLYRRPSRGARSGRRALRLQTP